MTRDVPSWDLLGHLWVSRTLEHRDPSLNPRSTSGCPLTRKSPTCLHLFAPLYDGKDDDHCPLQLIESPGLVPDPGESLSALLWGIESHSLEGISPPENLLGHCAFPPFGLQQGAKKLFVKGPRVNILIFEGSTVCHNCSALLS